MVTISRKASVLILIHKNLSCAIKSIDTDDQGCFVTAHLLVAFRELQITNVYAQNSLG